MSSGPRSNAEARELETNPAEELAETGRPLPAGGRTYREARELPTKSSQDRELWLKTLVEKELGISTEDTSSPSRTPLSWDWHVITGAAVPMVPHFF